MIVKHKNTMNLVIWYNRHNNWTQKHNITMENNMPDNQSNQTQRTDTGWLKNKYWIKNCCCYIQDSHIRFPDPHYIVRIQIQIQCPMSIIDIVDGLIALSKLPNQPITVQWLVHSPTNKFLFNNAGLNVDAENISESNWDDLSWQLRRLATMR